MPLPNEFSEWEHLQDQTRRVHNREVSEWFSDAPELDISTPRASLRHACTIKDNDTAVMTFMRMWLFEVQAKHARSFHPDIYGIPITTFQESIKFKPQIQLYFLEPQSSVDTGYSAVEGEISFRLTEPQYENITPVEAKSLANRIKSALATPVFVWKKGRLQVTYRDELKGYAFRILATSEAEAKRVIEQVMDIRQHTPDWDNLVVHEARKSFPIVPGNQVVYGKSRRKPRQRPRADVRFRYATLHLHGVPNGITLVDVSGTRNNPLVTA